MSTTKTRAKPVLAASILALAVMSCKSEDSATEASQTEETVPANDEREGATSPETSSTEPAGADPETAADDGESEIPPREDDSDRESKNGRTEGTVDGVDITITYGRPKVRDREIFGALVPFDAVWRTGANEATTITLSDDATIEGEPLSAGTYGLFTIPGNDTWTIIFNREPEQWGAAKYDESKDALRVEVDAAELDETVEELTFAIEDSNVVLRWEKTEVAFDVSSS